MSAPHNQIPPVTTKEYEYIKYSWIKKKKLYVLTQNCRITSAWLNKLVCSGHYWHLLSPTLGHPSLRQDKGKLPKMSIVPLYRLLASVNKFMINLIVKYHCVYLTMLGPVAMYSNIKKKQSRCWWLKVTIRKKSICNSG